MPAIYRDRGKSQDLSQLKPSLRLKPQAASPPLGPLRLDPPPRRPPLRLTPQAATPRAARRAALFSASRRKPHRPPLRLSPRAAPPSSPIHTAAGKLNMDLETENRLASLLMEEARRMRLQAEKEGVHVYLHQPNVRGRPNSRFLTATVLGVQQANRAVEVTEMWRAREKELELEAKLEDRSRNYRHKGSRGEKHNTSSQHMGSSSRHKQENMSSVVSYSSSKQEMEDCCSHEDDGLRDEEVEEFLQLRAKRGRGAIGSRMDEAGPYLSRTSSDRDGHLLCHDVREKEEWETRILGPEKPSFLKLGSPRNDSDTETRVCGTSSSRKCHSKNRRSKEEKSGKRKGKEKRSKHHNKSRRIKD